MKYGTCILCDRSTRRKPNELRPCCNKCEKHAPVAVTCPAAFTRGPAGKLARSAMALAREQNGVAQ